MKGETIKPVFIENKMNALAQNVTKLSKDYEALKKKCRQQQAEIEELKAKLGCDPAYFDMPARKLTDEEITEMAKRKTNQILMDLLMPDVGNEKRIDWNVGCTREHLKNFAKAILKKAHEK